MFKILSLGLLVSLSLMAVETPNTNVEVGKELYVKCSGCHGKNGEKKALGQSKIINKMKKEDLIVAINGYKNGTYGGRMKGLMKSQVSKLSDTDIKDISNYIYSKEHKNKIKEISKKETPNTNIEVGKELYVKCSGCHGKNGEKKALGQSKIINKMKKEDLIVAINGYKNGTYGGRMKGLMKSQVSKLSDTDIKDISNYINTFKDK